MPTSRRVVRPDEQFIKDLTARRIASMLPTGFRWFAESAFERNKELGTHIRAFANIVGKLRYQAESLRYDIFTATDDIDKIGNALKIPRLPGEDTEAYAQRINSKLVAELVTGPAIEKAVAALTDEDVGVVAVDVGDTVLIWGERTRRSSRWKWTNSMYNRGAVLEVKTNLYVPGLESFLNEAKAGGVKAYSALHMEANSPYNDDPLAAIWPDSGLPMSFVSSSFDVVIQSFGTSTDFDPVCFDLASTLDVSVFGGSALTWCSLATFDNLAKNYVLETDMIASAALGVPVHRAVVYDEIAPWGPSSMQPGIEFQYETTLGDTGVIGDGTL